VATDLFGLQQFFFLFLGLTLNQRGDLIRKWLGLDSFFLDLRTCGGLSSWCRLEPWLWHPHHLLGHTVSLLLILVARLVNFEFRLDCSGAQQSLQGLIAPCRLLGKIKNPSRGRPVFRMIRSRRAHGVSVLLSNLLFGKHDHGISL
jgi:hypothetical protein